MFRANSKKYGAQHVEPGQTSFNFRSTAAMLDTLTKLPREDFKKVRHVRVKGFPLPLFPCELVDEYVPYFTHYFDQALNMLPGLQLDCLTVLDCFHDEIAQDDYANRATYQVIEALIMTSGWKELRFIAPTTGFILGQEFPSETRKPQPATWNELIQKLDGKTSNAEVKMYIAKEAGTAGLSENPATRVTWECEPGNGPARESSEGVDKRDTREVLVVVKRGLEANYIQDGSQLHKNIKGLLREFGSWKEIKKRGCYLDSENDPCSHL